MIETQRSGKRYSNYSNRIVLKNCNKIPLHNGNSVKIIVRSGKYQKVGFSTNNIRKFYSMV